MSRLMPTDGNTPKWYTRVLRDGEMGRDVDVVQRKLGVFSGSYDEATQAHVRGLQRKAGLEVDGIVGPLTANALGEAADQALPPVWFSRDLRIGCEGEDVASLRSSLGLPSGSSYDDETRRAVLRFQSAHGLELSGVVNVGIAMQLP